ncbi:hypothetical protein HYFRA_00010533 [Hymenoscyphus fraxineus]|uniref:Rhodopsin domain-containing protein n=1 Tax=Hymenoscyphus fraxineus TaxID=746836 RepID=A0A9N9L4B5_9HELO|nr:hypothetical protein HYFRA_00010533 [Hymenoscyphus fraxineus]
MAVPNWSSPKGHHWTFTVISLLLVVFRLSIRLKTAGRIWLDDILIILAWLMVLGSTTLYQVEATNLYNHFPLVTGALPATPYNLKNEVSLLYAELAEFVLAYTTLLLVKLSILWFFRRLFLTPQQSAWLKSWWWFVTGWVFASWAACIATIPYNCLIKPIPYILNLCAVPEGITYVWINLQLSCATDIVADVFLIAIPVAALWNIRIQPRKKLMLVGILSLAMLTMICAILRIGVMPNKQASADISWLCLWAHVEITFAVLVSSLTSFRQLFTKPEPTTRHQNNKRSEWHGLEDTPNPKSNSSTPRSWIGLNNNIPTMVTTNSSTVVNSLQTKHSGVSQENITHRWYWMKKGDGATTDNLFKSIVLIELNSRVMELGTMLLEKGTRISV